MQLICYEIKATEVLIDSKALDMVQNRNVHFIFFYVNSKFQSWGLQDSTIETKKYFNFYIDLSLFLNLW